MPTPQQQLIRDINRQGTKISLSTAILWVLPIVVFFFMYIFSIESRYGLAGLRVLEKYQALFWITLVFLITGAIGVQRGVKKLKNPRGIQDTPTSVIGTGAIGSEVEITGKIPFDNESLLKGPISGKPCCYYFVILQKYYINSDWHGVYWFHSSDALYIGAGRKAYSLVMLNREAINNYCFGTNYYGDGVIDFKYKKTLNFDSTKALLNYPAYQAIEKFKDFNIIDMKFSLEGPYRFKEYLFKPQDEIYVKGYAKSGVDLKLVNLPPLKTVQKSFEEQKREIIRRGGSQLINMVFDKEKNSKIIISNIPEKELAQKHSWYAKAEFIIGIFLIFSGVGCVLFLEILLDGLG